MRITRRFDLRPERNCDGAIVVKVVDGWSISALNTRVFLYLIRLGIPTLCRNSLGIAGDENVTYLRQDLFVKNAHFPDRYDTKFVIYRTTCI